MADIIEICFPQDQSEGTEASVTRWLVTAGDRVGAHEPVVEIETDKVVVEVAAPAAGRIVDIRIQQDEDVSPGDVLCTLNTDAEAGIDRHSSSEPETRTIDSNSQTPRDRLSPAVRQRVLQHKLDVSGIAGSGRGGRITLQDVEALIAATGEKGSGRQQAPVTPSFSSAEGADIIPHDKMRKRIADNMVASLMHTAPHVTAVFEADLSAVMRHRSGNKAAYADRGTPLTLTVYFVAAAIAAIQKVPRVNSRWHADHLEIFHHINMGIGTALGDQGLIVPVLHNAQNMDLSSIAAGLADLTSRARDNKLKPEDVRGGTFTISNHGVSGSLIATPIIINQPQSAILGVGKIEKRIKIREIEGEDVMAIRSLCYVSLTIDHRVVDGFQTNAFLTELVNTLENWS
ncbi:MAG: 2-oxo acid dehydrogenase subunit E2 [Gammaproteobacteria bacterium]|nr:MAG: 2-oxo acid dehydrogenase subunit E2 [Gammaproteobacteria bacterium]